MKCGRCGSNMREHTVSWFTDDDICFECTKEEQNHPKYEEAKQKQYEEEAKGNRNFYGIGWDK